MSNQTVSKRVSKVPKGNKKDTKQIAADSPQTKIQALQQQVDSLQADNAKLKKINEVLIQRVDMGMGNHSNAYQSFETAVLLTDKVKQRTLKLQSALTRVEDANRQLQVARIESEQSRQRLVDAIESISDAFVLFDSQRRMILANSRFYEFWEQSQVDFALGETSLQDIKQAAYDAGLFDPKVNQRGKIKVKSNMLGQGVIQIKNGRWIRVSERPTVDGGLVMVYTDITAIKESETRRREIALAQKSLILQSTLDNISQGVALVNEQDKLEAWNDSFLLVAGLSTEQVSSGQSFTQLMQGKEVQFDMPESHGDTIYQFETTLSNGHVLEIKCHAIESGGYVNTYTDVSQQRETSEALRTSYQTMEQRVHERTQDLRYLNKQLEQEIQERELIETDLLSANYAAEQANISKTKFMAAISHDLLQPMNAARLFTSVLNETTDPVKVSELVNSLTFSLEDMESLLNALVEISKLDAGVVKAVAESFSVNDLLQNLANEYQSQASKKGIEFVYKPTKAVVYTDSQLLARVLRNFLGNALRYTEQGKILLGCRRRSHGLEVQVIDTGQGIAEGKISEIFQEFKRGDNVSQRADRGLGLGLAIVEKLCSVLGHEVKVNSLIGKGSMFSVVLPYGEIPQKKTSTVMEDDLSKLQMFNGKKILVVDNDLSICEGMSHLLGLWGCEVLTMQSLQELKSKNHVLDEGLDMIIVDYHLDNEETGVQLIDYVKQIVTVPTLMVTANNTNELRQKMKQEGHYFINKPIKPFKLKSLMQHVFK